MSPAERDTLATQMVRVTSYFEFGMGGSTLMAARAGVKQIVSVDSDKAWVDAVGAHPETAPRCADGSASLLHADIGPVADWGRPADRSALRKWSQYLSVGWAEWSRRNTLPELILIDGRFRVASCISIALVCAQSASPCVLLHDVDDSRAHYRDALQFLEQMDQVETLLIMKPRKDVSPALSLSRTLDQQFDFT